MASLKATGISLSSGCLVSVLLLFLTIPAVAEGLAASDVAALTDRFLTQHAYLLDPVSRKNVAELQSKLRDSLKAGTPQETQDAESLASLILQTLERSAHTLYIDLRPGAHAPAGGLFQMPGDFGAVFVKAVRGEREITCSTLDYSMSVNKVDSIDDLAVPIEVAPECTTWVLAEIEHLSVGKSTLYFSFHGNEMQPVQVPLELERPEDARLKVAVQVGEEKGGAPAMMRLRNKTTERDYKPANAYDLASPLEGLGIASSDRPHKLLGDAGGTFWCVPGPFEMALPPGDWEVTVRSGLELTPVVDRFYLQEGECADRTYTLHRWINLSKRGWYSGDDHVHFTLRSDHDARMLLDWTRAEDVNLVNVLMLDSVDRPYYDVWGFGRDYRTRSGNSTIVSGQEAPRTPELGHTLGLNTTCFVRDTDEYYLYDSAFDALRRQGALTGFAHVAWEGFNVHRGLALDVPTGRVDFLEILQFAKMKTKLYFDFLNLGFKLTASAGTDVPWGGTVGEDRVYALLGKGRFTADRWFESFRNGRTFVTNGPIIDFTIDDKPAGSEIYIRKDQLVRVRVHARMNSEGAGLAWLRLVCHGDVIRSEVAQRPGTSELSIECEVDGKDGCWIAAQAAGRDGSSALTTPVYLVRAPLRFWKFDAVEALVDERLRHLDEITEVVDQARRYFEKGGLPLSSEVPPGFTNDTTGLAWLGSNGQALIDRVNVARAVYEQLLDMHRRELALRVR
jgi:hypothetical protein